MDRTTTFVCCVASVSSSLIVSGPAAAQERPALATAVDASGKIVPLLPAAPPPPERMNEEESRVADPCPGARPLAADAARALVLKIATDEGFYPQFVFSVAKIESGFNSTSLSAKGAFGLMQLMPDTAKAVGVNICDPAENVRGGVRELRALHARYRNPFYMLAAYNAGPEALERNHGLPPYAETLNYVAKVINDFYDYPNLGGVGPGDGVAADPRAAAKREAVASISTKPEEAGWRSGFVMNFEYQDGAQK